MIDYYVDNVFSNLITSDAVDKERFMKIFSEKFKSLLKKCLPLKGGTQFVIFLPENWFMKIFLGKRKWWESL